MAPRKRCAVASTHADNTRGFAALPDEIYLEIVSYIPSVSIPTLILSVSYPEIRRVRHETLLSLSQTSRSLRRVFWRYLWQRIEVREGMKSGDKDDTLKTGMEFLGDTKHARRLYEAYATELVRQLEIVTIRNPQLAQYVNYLDIFIGEYSFQTVLAELARCLSLFSNLHTVQIDVPNSRPSLRTIFEHTFKKRSYPQIRNVFIMDVSKSFIVSCPQVRCIGYTQPWTMSRLCLLTITDNCPHLEVLEAFVDIDRNPDAWKLVVDSCPNLHIVKLFPSTWDPQIAVLQELKHLQTVIIDWQHPQTSYMWPPIKESVMEHWTELVKHILIQIQLRDNLEKTIVQLPLYGNERRILIKPKASIGSQMESFES